MTVLRNEITIQAPVEEVWEALSNIETLEKYDPVVKRSRAISRNTSGIDAARKVEMSDGKNWFEERCTVSKSGEALEYELTACSFPVHRLKHSYTFDEHRNGVTVKQVMEYEIKYGWLGRILDAWIIRRQSDSGIKNFFSGLKNYVEKH
jgi:ribosome-associated toxin RatA of RatAB toxin-antitoxin module